MSELETVKLYECDCPRKRSLNQVCNFNTDIGDNYPCRSKPVTYVSVESVAAAGSELLEQWRKVGYAAREGRHPTAGVLLTTANQLEDFLQALLERGDG